MIAPGWLAKLDLHSIGASLIILALATPLIAGFVVYYLKKQLEHRQIMAAIEKGTPLAEIMPPKPQPVGPAWIRYASAGAALLVIGLGGLLFSKAISRNPWFFIAFIVTGAGAGWLTRGLLHRKYYLKGQTDVEIAPKSKKAT